MIDAKFSEFLLELFRQTEGDVENTVSMHDVGLAMGLEKNDSGSLAEELIMDDLVELKTLAGGIGITGKGIDLLVKEGVVQASSGNAMRLSGKAVLEQEDREIINKIVKEIQAAVSSKEADFEATEQIVIDIKTIEVQLLSSSPKADIVLAVLRSLQGCLKSIGHNDAADLVASVLSS